MISSKTIGDKIYSNRASIIKNLVAGVLIFLVLVLEGCINFIDFTFDIYNLLKLDLWVQIFTKVLLLVLIRMACMFIFLDVARNTNLDLQKEIKLNEKLLKLKGSDFNIFCENVKNKEIKKETFTKKIQKKLSKLEKRAKLSDRLLYFNTDAIYIEEKKINKYCIKRKQYEEMPTNEYQEKNYQLLNVRGYEHIDPAVFDIPVSTREVNKYQLTSRTKMAIGTTIFTAAIMLIFTQTVWNAAQLTAKEDLSGIAITIGILMDILFILWQCINGITTSFTTINDQEVLPYCNRNRILKEYLYWKEPNKKDNLTIWIEKLEQSSIDELNK